MRREDLPFASSTLCDARVVADAFEVLSRLASGIAKTFSILVFSSSNPAMKIMLMICWEKFPRRLFFWSICGLGCALPSFIYASMGEFNIPGMVVGTGMWILSYALFTSSYFYVQKWANGQIGKFLRVGVVIRAILGFVASIGFLGATPLIIVSLIDFYPGYLAVGITQFLSGHVVAHSSPTGFGWTLVTTLVQGGFVSVEMILIVLPFNSYARRRSLRLEGKTGGG